MQTKATPTRRPHGWWDQPEIRQDFEGLAPAELMKKYGLSETYVSQLRRRMKDRPGGTRGKDVSEAEKIGTELREMRLAAGMSQTEFGQLVHCGRGIVALWESGKRKCPPEKLELLRIKLNREGSTP